MYTGHYNILCIYVCTAESCNEVLKFSSYCYKIVAVLTNIKINGPKLVRM